MDILLHEFWNLSDFFKICNRGFPYVSYDTDEIYETFFKC